MIPWLFIAWLLFGVIGAAWVGHDLTTPGIYDDEVVQADPALQFLDPDRPRVGIPGASTLRVFGRDFPFMTQPYMGALKSQLLIPVFALSGASTPALRATTLLWSWAGLGLMLAWAARALGVRVALLAGLMLSLDPSFLWVSRHDWGSFALGFLLRCGSLYFLLRGWQERRSGWLALGGLCVGMGLFNKIDFVVFPLAAGLSLAIVQPGIVAQAWRERRLEALAAAAGFGIGAAPLLAALAQVVAVTETAFAIAWTGLAFKLNLLATTLDGSHWDTLMRVGGRHHFVAEADPVHGPFLWIFLATGLWLAVRVVRRWRSQPRESVRADAFVLLTTVGIVAGLLLIPRTQRIHHALNLYPFPQLVVAIALVRLWAGDGVPGTARRLHRGTAALVLAMTLAGSLYVDHGTWRTIDISGGKGLWSATRSRHAAELFEQDPRSTAVALDWGFTWGLRWERPGLALIDLPSDYGLRGYEPRSFDGTPQFEYLFFPRATPPFPTLRNSSQPRGGCRQIWFRCATTSTARATWRSARSASATPTA